MNRATMYRRLGMVFWCFLIGAVGDATWRLFSSDQTDETANRSSSLIRYLAGPAATPLAIDPTGQLRIGDPVFLHTQESGWRQIGHVTHVLETPEHAELELAWYADDLRPDSCELVQYHNRGRMEDVVKMLLPEEKRQRIQQQLVEAFQVHGDEISAAIVPRVEQSLRESLPLIETELKASVSRHRGEVEAVAGRLNRDLVQGRLIPLAKDQLMPIVRRHAEEPAEAIGRDLWDRASLWRFGWRALYDSTPLPRKGLVREEWKRFVDEEATKVIESHLDEMTVAVQRIVADVAVDPDIRRELAEAAESVAGDAQSRALVQIILKEAVVENQSLRDHLRTIWTSPQASAALSIASNRLEPVVRSIGDEIFGSRTGGIDPDFARVLRNQILGKDRRWIVANERPNYMQSTAATRLEIQLSHELMAFPIVYVADSSLEKVP